MHHQDFAKINGAGQVIRPAVFCRPDEVYYQCDRKKIPKCLKKLPKNDFTRKMIDFDTFTKIA